MHNVSARNLFVCIQQSFQISDNYLLGIETCFSIRVRVGFCLEKYFPMSPLLVWCTGASACSLCQPGTYQTGSGRPNLICKTSCFHPALSVQCRAYHLQSLLLALKSSACRDRVECCRLIPVCIHHYCLRAPHGTQGPPLPAIAAIVRQGHTKRDQVCQRCNIIVIIMLQAREMY